MYKRIFPVLLTIIITGVTLTSCSAQEYTWVVEINGKEISPSMYLTAQLEAYIEAEFAVNDSSKSFSSQEIDGVPVSDWIYTKTIENLQKWCFIEDKFKERNLSIDSDEQAYITEQSAQTWEQIKYLYEDNGIDFEAYNNYVTYLYEYQILFNDIFSEGSQWEITDEEISNYIIENISNIRGFQIAKINNDGTSINNDIQKTLYNYASTACEKINNGASFIDIAGEYMSLTGDLLGSNVDFSDASDYIVTAYITHETYGLDPEFVKQSFEVDINACAIYDMGEYYLVYQRVPSYENYEEFLYLKQVVLNSLKSDEFEEFIFNEYTKLPVTVNEDAIKHYSSSKIKLNM